MDLRLTTLKAVFFYLGAQCFTPFPPKRCLWLSWPQGHNAARRIKPIKNPSDHIRKEPETFWLRAECLNQLCIRVTPKLKQKQVANFSKIFNVVYIWTYVWQRWKPSCSIWVHNVSTLNQCREFSYVTVVYKHFASYQDYPNYRWDLIRYAKG
jgi:hypothetical protein